MSIIKINKDVDLLILDLLEINDLCKIAQVSKYYHQIIRQKLLNFYEFFNIFVQKIGNQILSSDEIGRIYKKQRYNDYLFEISLVGKSIKFNNYEVFEYLWNQYFKEIEKKIDELNIEHILYICINNKEKTNLEIFKFLWSIAIRNNIYIDYIIYKSIINNVNKNLIEIILDTVNIKFIDEKEDIFKMVFCEYPQLAYEKLDISDMDCIRMIREMYLNPHINDLPEINYDVVDWIYHMYFDDKCKFKLEQQNINKYKELEKILLMMIIIKNNNELFLKFIHQVKITSDHLVLAIKYNRINMFEMMYSFEDHKIPNLILEAYKNNNIKIVEYLLIYISIIDIKELIYQILLTYHNFDKLYYDWRIFEKMTLDTFKHFIKNIYNLSSIIEIIKKIHRIDRINKQIIEYIQDDYITNLYNTYKLIEEDNLEKFIVYTKSPYDIRIKHSIFVNDAVKIYEYYHNIDNIGDDIEEIIPEKSIKIIQFIYEKYEDKFYEHMKSIFNRLRIHNEYKSIIYLLDIIKKRRSDKADEIINILNS